MFLGQVEYRNEGGRQERRKAKVIQQARKYIKLIPKMGMMYVTVAGKFVASHPTLKAL